MTKKLVIPHFSSEAEDAEWHQKHKRELEQEFGRQWDAGTTFRRTKGNPALRRITIRLSNQDIESAQKQALKHSVGHQTYIRMILHQALRRKASGR
jgi:predicted DNA binding CopG/RHH family protein